MCAIRGTADESELWLALWRHWLGMEIAGGELSGEREVCEPCSLGGWMSRCAYETMTPVCRFWILPRHTAHAPFRSFTSASHSSHSVRWPQGR